MNFVPTHLASVTLDLISATHDFGDIGVIYGPRPAWGKAWC
ncbi:hypothetical protein [Sodalis sp. (in: enterobacteria)]